MLVCINSVSTYLDTEDSTVTYSLQLWQSEEKGTLSAYRKSHTRCADGAVMFTAYEGLLPYIAISLDDSLRTLNDNMTTPLFLLQAFEVSCDSRTLPEKHGRRPAAALGRG